MRGAPRYFEGSVAMEKPSSLAMLCWVSAGVLKKEMYDFPAFMVVPEASEKVCSRDLKELASWIEGWPNSMLSSTNC